MNSHYSHARIWKNSHFQDFLPSKKLKTKTKHSIQQLLSTDLHMSLYMLYIYRYAALFVIAKHWEKSKPKKDRTKFFSKKFCFHCTEDYK